MPSTPDDATHPTNPMDSVADVEPYEVRLRQSFTFAVQESGAYYSGGGALHETLHRLVERLDASGIPYAVIGAFALGAHGYVRMTADLDLVMTAEGLRRFTEEWVGRDYRPAFAGAVRMFRVFRVFRDVETNVRIDIVEAGTFPGDGRPKPVAFPDPSVAELRGRVRIVGFARLIELKLASGMSAADRLRDLADVQEMIRALALPREFGGRLDGSVRGEYERLWGTVTEAESGSP